MTPVSGDETISTAEAAIGLVGTMVDLRAGEVLLPEFVSRRGEGLFVDSARAAGGQFARFVERVFVVGGYFSGLDYPVFLSLLYDEGHCPADTAPVRLATDLLPFPPPRQALYRMLKLIDDGDAAEYMFEPVSLEIEEEAENGEMRVRSEPATLDFDEFVAHCWTNGIRAGIDEKAVRGAIAKNVTERMTVARAVAPTPGSNATLEEKSKALHRDNSPRTLANGHIDLSQFSNRYPQVSEGEILLRKVPRKLGKPGRTLGGESVEPDLPADFQLSDLVGAGTRLEQREDGEYIVAALTGFLDLDPGSNQIAVTEKIVSREGVSMRTTGNLSLAGDDYEEYGEVQERRVVEGKNLTFHANVYGILQSRGGVIRIDAILSGGKASSPGGEVVIGGRASASVVEAFGGKVHIKYAEGCTICARDVVIEHAVMSQIVGENVQIGTSESCAVAGKSVDIGVSSSRKDVETVVSVMVPDFSAQEEQARSLSTTIADKQGQIQLAREKMGAISGQKDLANFLVLQNKVKKGEIKLAPAQSAGLQKAAAQFAPLLQELRTLNTNIHGLEGEVVTLVRQAAEVEQKRVALSQGMRCLLDGITGDTVVRTRHYDPLAGYLGDAQCAALLAQLRSLGEVSERLFSGTSGRFGWQYGADATLADDEGWVK